MNGSDDDQRRPWIALWTHARHRQPQITRCRAPSRLRFSLSRRSRVQRQWRDRPSTATKLLNGTGPSVPIDLHLRQRRRQRQRHLAPSRVPLPATPLSAALGPAAQATLPSCVDIPRCRRPRPPSDLDPRIGAFRRPRRRRWCRARRPRAYGDCFFRGDVFQRADSLLSMQGQGYGGFLRRGREG